MIDPVSTVTAAVVFAAGWLVGRHARLKRAPSQPKPICMCEHHYGTHDPQTGACGAFEVEERYDSIRGRYNETDQCACVRYTGPQPVEQFWVPPAADMSIVTAPRVVDGQ